MQVGYEVRVQSSDGWLCIGKTINLDMAIDVARRAAEVERTIGRVIDLEINDSRLSIVFEHFGPPPDPDPWDVGWKKEVELDGCEWSADGF